MIYREHFEAVYTILSTEFDEHCYTFLEADTPSAFGILLLAISSAAMSVAEVNDLRNMPVYWLATCQEWLLKQRPKRRDLLYYQIACLTYLARRTHGLEKKHYWRETGALLQTA